MEFKKCSINGVVFGDGVTEAMLGAAKRDGRDLDLTMESQAEELNQSKERMVNTMRKTFNNRYLRKDKLTLISSDLADRLSNPHDTLRKPIVDFFRALAICHSVLSDTPDPKNPHILDYKAESPDEAALVGGARDLGFPFIGKNANRLDIEVLGKPERWTPLRVLEFNSSRKRMSVIARDPNGRLVLFCKGADSVIYQRLAPNHDQQLKQSTLKDLEIFANGGLRTLCVAYRYLSEEEFEQWSKVYDASCAAVTDRDLQIDEACELIEHELYILGATALEDKLQEGVPDAIATLHNAGIKLWILTGDKLQTAIEIGYSCNLLTNEMEIMIISADSEEDAQSHIEAALNKIASMTGLAASTNGTTRQATFAVVIDGDSLRFALLPSLKSLFLSLGTQCAAVICCRVSPSQKALTVRLVKEGCHAMCLSIGDGANDVAMIQEANIGVGLYGLEGSQAAMSADYAFGQFRFLTRLLLVHGRWSYVRIADMHAKWVQARGGVRAYAIASSTRMLSGQSPCSGSSSLTGELVVPSGRLRQFRRIIPVRVHLAALLQSHLHLFTRRYARRPRSRHQRRCVVGISSVVQARDQRPRLHSNPILALHGGRLVSIRRNLLHPAARIRRRHDMVVVWARHERPLRLWHSRGLRWCRIGKPIRRSQHQVLDDHPNGRHSRLNSPGLHLGPNLLGIGCLAFLGRSGCRLFDILLLDNAHHYRLRRHRAQMASEGDTTILLPTGQRHHSGGLGCRGSERPAWRAASQADTSDAGLGRSKEAKEVI